MHLQLQRKERATKWLPTYMCWNQAGCIEITWSQDSFHFTNKKLTALGKINQLKHKDQFLKT